ncbi:hypothetical protein K7X08_035984 [Anisodus acutangulus]|uniref:Uncharacterized protein n=1 Tax=Anisodus acutangulus TaxID=402998 RepID=A0A9Q1QVH0_9SOLA|nr:hypothetical protein K7X08_035984 [Anisodus acutangulus]
MDLNKLVEKGKKGLIPKTWERCKSFGRKKSSENYRHAMTTKRTRKKFRVAKQGCFSVYVGPEKQRFVIRTEYVNHPLFKMLLEEAESEFGYNSKGPLALPCDVDYFLKFLMEIDSNDEIFGHHRNGCSFSRSYSSSYHLTPTIYLFP